MNNIEELVNEGLLALQLREYEKALEKFQAARKLDVRSAEIEFNIGLTLYRMGRLDEAESAFQTTVGLDICFADAAAMLAQISVDKKDHKRAIERFDFAIKYETDPNKRANLKTVQSHCYLALGKYRTGFKLFEERNYKAPCTWDRKTSLVGRDLFVIGTQGLGDQLFFSRWLPMLQHLGAKSISLFVDEPLWPFFDRVFEGEFEYTFLDHCWDKAELPEKLTQNPDALTVDMASLPHIFGVSAGTIPMLKNPAPHEKIRWVNLVWSGNPLHVNDHNRSIPLEKLEPLWALDKDIVFFSFQPFVRASDKEAFDRSSITTAEIDDFYDVWEFCVPSDPIITVDTAMANFAGLMGLRAWVLLPYACDWRWGVEGDSTPWYPSVKLFRQGEDRQWGPVIEAVAEELKRELA